MSFFSSWWSPQPSDPQPNEEKKDAESVAKAGGNTDATARPSDWMSGFESKLVADKKSCFIATTFHGDIIVRLYG